MPKPVRPPERPPERPEVIDLNARRRVAELKAAARKSTRPSGPKFPLDHPLAAWAVLILVAVLWALIRWLRT